MNEGGGGPWNRAHPFTLRRRQEGLMQTDQISPDHPMVPFIRRWAEYHAYSEAGDREAQQVVDQYDGLRWAGHRPEDALAIAVMEIMGGRRIR